MNKRYIAYNQAILDGTFKPEIIHDMIDDLGKTTRQYGENSNKETLRNNLPLLKPILAGFFRVPEEYIKLEEMKSYPRKWVRSFDSINAVKAEHERVLRGRFDERHVWPLIKNLGVCCFTW